MFPPKYPHVSVQQMMILANEFNVFCFSNNLITHVHFVILGLLQDLIEMLNRNQMTDLSPDVNQEHQHEADLIAEKQKRLEAELARFKEEEARRERAREERLRQEREIREMEELQEIEAQRKHAVDMQRKNDLLQDSFPLINGAAAVNNTSPLLPSADDLYSPKESGATSGKPQSPGRASTQPFSPHASGMSYQSGGESSSSTYARAPGMDERTTESKQETVDEVDELIDEHIEGDTADGKDSDEDFNF